jgi:Protein of unknown function (DUF3047)
MTDTRLTRRALVVITVAGFLGGWRAPAGGASRSAAPAQTPAQTPAQKPARTPTRTVEDWRDMPLGSRGVPPGWRKYETPGGQPAYDFTVVEDAGRRALDLKSAADHSTIAKEFRVSLETTPLLEWEWRVLALPSGADLRERVTSDAAGHLFVIWPRFPALLRSRLIGYVWDARLPIGTVVKSRKTSTVTFIVVRRGVEGLGQWLTERRNVADDHRRVFSEAPDDPEAVALSIDTNDTRSTAGTRFARIAFTGA